MEHRDTPHFASPRNKLTLLDSKKSSQTSPYNSIPNESRINPLKTTKAKKNDDFNMWSDSKQDTFYIRNSGRKSPIFSSNLSPKVLHEFSADEDSSKAKRSRMMPSPTGYDLSSTTLNNKSKSPEAKKGMSSQRAGLKFEFGGSNIIDGSRISPTRSFLYDFHTSGISPRSGGASARNERREIEALKAEIDKLKAEKDFYKDQVTDLKIQLEANFMKSIDQTAIDTSKLRFNRRLEAKGHICRIQVY